MKVAVLGATGRTGVPLVRQALEKGHHVVAIVRDRSKVTIEHECLQDFVQQNHIMEDTRALNQPGLNAQKLAEARERW
ncbi:flavin reductase (NADPH)-like [Saccoglossus kowalevskii]